jgi:hypothetical protein
MPLEPQKGPRSFPAKDKMEIFRHDRNYTEEGGAAARGRGMAVTIFPPMGHQLKILFCLTSALISSIALIRHFSVILSKIFSTLSQFQNSVSFEIGSGKSGLWPLFPLNLRLRFQNPTF